jgi:hypothetical protein
VSGAQIIDRREPLRDGEPCRHPGCLSHISHPCEDCGRIGGLTPPPFVPLHIVDLLAVPVDRREVTAKIVAVGLEAAYAAGLRRRNVLLRLVVNTKVPCAPCGADNPAGATLCRRCGKDPATRWIPCPECGGTGAIETSSDRSRCHPGDPITCPDCEGHKEVEAPAWLDREAALAEIRGEGA